MRRVVATPVAKSAWRPSAPRRAGPTPEGPFVRPHSLTADSSAASLCVLYRNSPGAHTDARRQRRPINDPGRRSRCSDAALSIQPVRRDLKGSLNAVPVRVGRSPSDWVPPTVFRAACCVPTSSVDATLSVDRVVCGVTDGRTPPNASGDYVWSGRGTSAGASVTERRTRRFQTRNRPAGQRALEGATWGARSISRRQAADGRRRRDRRRRSTAALLSRSRAGSKLGAPARRSCATGSGLAGPTTTGRQLSSRDRRPSSQSAESASSPRRRHLFCTASHHEPSLESAVDADLDSSSRPGGPPSPNDRPLGVRRTGSPLSTSTSSSAGPPVSRYRERSPRQSRRRRFRCALTAR